MAITISPATASVAHGGSTQQFTTTQGDFYQWAIQKPDETGSSIDQNGLFTSGPNTGTVNVTALRYDGEQAIPVATVTVT